MNVSLLRRSVYGLGLIGLALFAAGCATSPVTAPSPVAPVRPSVTTILQDASFAGQPGMQGMYHSVVPGDTLWRISQMYGVDPEVIQRANRIVDPAKIDIGRRLYIPYARQRKNILTLYPSTKWNYIIIHHSATDFGGSIEFNNAHQERGWSGIGYHFVILNGSNGEGDGFIESTPRWINQVDGAHCRAAGMNTNGIGICLVGNFSSGGKLSAKQMDSLVFLVKELSEFYNIPHSNIMGHGQVPGANTECPGKHFPWDEFWRRLRRS